jgi:hypothetical protein
MMVDDAIESLAVIYKSDEGLLVAVSYLLYHYLKNKQHAGLYQDKKETIRWNGDHCEYFDINKRS